MQRGNAQLREGDTERHADMREVLFQRKTREVVKVTSVEDWKTVELCMIICLLVCLTMGFLHYSNPPLASVFFGLGIIFVFVGRAVNKKTWVEVN